MAFIAAIVSHFPKRFMLRTRPYLVNRALKANIIHTSSFPSRAVVAGAIYTVVLLQILDVDVGIGGMIGYALLGIILSSCARINLGVHYPSD